MATKKKPKEEKPKPKEEKPQPAPEPTIRQPHDD